MLYLYINKKFLFIIYFCASWIKIAMKLNLIKMYKIRLKKLHKIRLYKIKLCKIKLKKTV